MSQSANAHALASAFDTFTTVSRDLDASYRRLEARIRELSSRLAQADREIESRQREQQRADERFGRLLDALPGGVVVIDADGVVRESNQAAQRLLAMEPTGRAWREVAAEAFAPRSDDGHDISLASGYRVNLSTCSMGDEPGQIVLLADVTETRRLQALAARLERVGVLGRTVSALAHQVRTPLGAALLYASSLPRGAAREKVVERLRALEGLVEDMLTYARLGEFEIEVLDLGELLSELCANQTAHKSQIQFVDGGEPGPFIHGNRAALTSAVQNLIDNAWHADPEANVALRVDCDSEAASVDINCRDDGPGIPPELGERIFDPLFSTRSDGSGLGLAIVRAIAQAHGGEISCDGGPGRGASFTLSLPRREDMRSGSRGGA